MRRRRSPGWCFDEMRERRSATRNRRAMLNGFVSLYIVVTRVAIGKGGHARRRATTSLAELFWRARPSRVTGHIAFLVRGAAHRRRRNIHKKTTHPQAPPLRPPQRSPRRSLRRSRLTEPAHDGDCVWNACAPMRTGVKGMSGVSNRQQSECERYERAEQHGE